MEKPWATCTLRRTGRKKELLGGATIGLVAAIGVSLSIVGHRRLGIGGETIGEKYHCITCHSCIKKLFGSVNSSQV